MNVFIKSQQKVSEYSKFPCTVIFWKEGYSLGVGLTESMVEAGYLEKEEKEFKVTPKGEQFFADFGIDIAVIRKSVDPFLVLVWIGANDNIILQVL